MARCPEAGRLEKRGYKLVSHLSKFGTCLKYRRGNDWKFVFPSRPCESLGLRDAVLYVRDHWLPRRPEEEEWMQKLLNSIM